MQEQDQISEIEALNLNHLLKAMIEKGASDLHITAGTSPSLRIDGSILPMKLPPLSPPDCKKLCYSILTDSQKARFEEEHELDLSFGVKGMARFRANLFFQRGVVSGVFRQIPFRISSIKDLGLPPSIEDLCLKPRGLVLVTGPTGAGKSTTLAAMIDKINRETQQHILTIEDPIEFLHPHKKSIVNQREIQQDTGSFANALKYILRQDPDVVMVGELRDLETIEAALTISETGHLCLATLHTNGAIQTISRIIDAFPPHQQAQVRTQLSLTLEGIISQSLLKKSSGVGRSLAAEILIPNAAIRNLIRENKIHQIYSQMQLGQEKYGMVTLNQSLSALYLERKITLDEALENTNDVDELRKMIMNSADKAEDASRAIGNLNSKFQKRGA